VSKKKHKTPEPIAEVSSPSAGTALAGSLRGFLYPPLASFSAGGIIICASGRLGFALTALAALLWVYSVSMLTVFCAKRICPKSYTDIFFLFLTAFSGGLFYFFLCALCPTLAQEAMIPLMLAPVVCAGSHGYGGTGISAGRITDIFPRVLKEPAGSGIVTVALSLIRESLAYGTLSLPGGESGLLIFIGGAADEGAVSGAVRILGTSAGALILAGYALVLLRFVFKRSGK
jgi:hypothetical protein